MESPSLTHPVWCRDTAIYQINTRQFTPEGTFAAAAAHLPRLRRLGVGILWLMPVHPIGRERRKGGLGSPYAVRDHYEVNPEFGNLDDLRRFVRAAHDQGMHVILDWVANHTAWDCNLVSEHPEWYARDEKGDFRPPPWQDWTDVIDLDYRHAGLRDYMTEAMAYWVQAADVDGYRCDVAGYVPVEFWRAVRRRLEAIKPVFLLAEWDARDLHAAFDATYAWSWYDAVRRITQGRTDLSALREYYASSAKAYPADAMRVTFVSNHDKNAWEGTEFEQFGDGLAAAIVLSVLGEGMPLIYNGQEAGNDRRLPFFDKDGIAWREHPLGELYERLLALKKRNSALWNAGWGAPMLRVVNDVPDRVLSFVRRNDRDRVLAVLNFAAEPRIVTLGELPCTGRWTDAFTQETVELTSGVRMRLRPWDFRVLIS